MKLALPPTLRAVVRTDLEVESFTLYLTEKILVESSTSTQNANPRYLPIAADAPLATGSVAQLAVVSQGNCDTCNIFPGMASICTQSGCSSCDICGLYGSPVAGRRRLLQTPPPVGVPLFFICAPSTNACNLCKLWNAMP